MCIRDRAQLDAHLLLFESANAVEWSPLSTRSEPMARSRHTCVFDTAENQVFMFGGKQEMLDEAMGDEPKPEEDSAIAGEGADGEEAAAEAEEGAASAAEAEEAGEAQAQVVYLNELYVGSVDGKENAVQWNMVCPTGEPPKPRVNCELELLDKKVLVYGGEDVEGNTLCDMHMYDPEDNSWRCVWDSLAPPEGKPMQVFFDVNKKQLLKLDGSSGAFDALEALDLEPLLAKGDNLIVERKGSAEKTLNELEDFGGKEGT
eukprot:TRINITY_DN8474_c0_g2_i1.p1 TRINITY_DN8474_c0_g2~~TRINITY_DN8474_c0_g2_i1.p1  ORF type:complete len:260 (+),score=92.71 TRINITY_DN8474_c0_g2_i1:188-967(+)